jgi:hypothetical protein
MNKQSAQKRPMSLWALLCADETAKPKLTLLSPVFEG